MADGGSPMADWADAMGEHAWPSHFHAVYAEYEASSSIEQARAMEPLAKIEPLR